MKLIGGKQIGDVEDPVRAKLAIVVPILKATLHSLAHDRIERLGGLPRITLHDLAREFREGHGDAGICFEYAVHEAIAANNPLIHPLVSGVLEELCKIAGGADSILFGPEKEGVIPIIESVTNALTDDSVVYVGNAGRPPKLRRYIPRIVRAYRRNEEQNRLPRSITGLWKADLFLGNRGADAWVGTTIKINPEQLQGARGLRIAIYPKRGPRDMPRKDDDLNLIRLPLPYDGQFMEVFYKSFFLTRAFLRADAEIPKPVDLPDAEDRLLTEQLRQRREFPIVDVIGALAGMAQPDLLEAAELRIAPSTRLYQKTLAFTRSFHLRVPRPRVRNADTSADVTRASFTSNFALDPLAARRGCRSTRALSEPKATGGCGLGSRRARVGSSRHR